MAAEINQMLEDLSLIQYRTPFHHAGLDNWASLCRITDAELEELGVRPGHRRKLQREVARRLLWPDFKPLPTSEELLGLLGDYEDATDVTSVNVGANGKGRCVAKGRGKGMDAGGEQKSDYFSLSS
ncbi:hypothetical protein LOCC1_G004935, partial [Lachnellula occidentalis]